MSLKKYFDEDRRLCVLRVLALAPSMQANHFVLQTALEGLGHRVSREKVQQDLCWLDETGLVRVEDLETITLASLTDKGLDVAEGRVSIPGVKRPIPGE